MSKSNYPYYIYLHTNGNLIAKVAYVVDKYSSPKEYFNSPYVKKWWKVKSPDDFEKIQAEAKELNNELN